MPNNANKDIDPDRSDVDAALNVLISVAVLAVEESVDELYSCAD
jgi:hypothetical protein